LRVPIIAAISDPADAPLECVCVGGGVGGLSKVKTVANNPLECDFYYTALHYTILYYSTLLYADSRDQYFNNI
jgi:hypothetical protein